MPLNQLLRVVNSKYLISIPLLFICFLSGCCKKDNSAPSIIDQHGSLSVEGVHIVNQHGEIVSFAGNSFFWSNTTFDSEAWYNPKTVDYLVKEWNTTIIRAAIGTDARGGYLHDKEANLKRLEILIDAAIDQGIYILIDWHSHNAEEYEEEAIQFFTEMAKRYGHLPNILYEIYNEPDNKPTKIDWSKDLKPYFENVISAIRDIDPDNLILIGSTNYSQDVDIASEDPITGYDNLAYTLHFYSGTHKEWLINKATTAIDNGLALFVSEYGVMNANGDGDIDDESTQNWLKFMRDHRLTHLNWAVNDKNESASIFKPKTSPTGPWTDEDLTKVGLYVKNIIKNWNTAD